MPRYQSATGAQRGGGRLNCRLEVRTPRVEIGKTRGNASRLAIGSTAAANRAPPCMSTRTVRSWLQPAAPTAAALALAIMAGETLTMRPIVVDTASVGYAHLTGGSRAAFATDMSVVETTATRMVSSASCMCPGTQLFPVLFAAMARELPKSGARSLTST
jgi:hypothetical protein